MPLPLLRRGIAASIALATATAAHAQHEGDIGLAVVDGRIVTTAIEGAALGSPRRVFAGSFGDTGVPWFTSNPGFDALPGTFPTGTRVGFRFSGPLLVWDGAGFVTTASDPALGERLRVSFLTLSATSGTEASPGFDLAVQGDGGWHRHLSMTMLPAAGAEAPAERTYAVQVELYSTAPGIAPSMAMWLVLDGGAPDFTDAFEAAEREIDPPVCAADLAVDGTVDGIDLGILLGNWGQPGSADLNADGVVDGVDLGILLGNWGPCP
jgi:hypothetical protein